MSRWILALALAVSGLHAAPAAKAIEPTTVAMRIEPSMVRIFVVGPHRTGAASGFVVSTEGHIATAYHIIQPHIDLGWELFAAESGASPKTRRPATVVKAYPDKDLAILQVEGLKRPPLVLSESASETLTKGTTVFAIGFPGAGARLGAESKTSFTAGVVNRIFTGAWTAEDAQIRIIQHSAATNPGNSGGPVVNPCGQVIGVNTEREMAVLITPTGLPMVYDVIQGVFFASHVSVLLEDLRALGVVYNGSPKVCRVFLGVASTNFPLYSMVAITALTVTVLLLLRYRPRGVVHVIVLGGSAARNRARAIGQLLRHPPWRHKHIDGTWHLRCEDVEGGPVDIVVTRDDLLQTPDGLVIGSDPSCDLCLAADGIAKRHARLMPLGDGIGVDDLHSESGTAVDEHPVEPQDGPAPLASGASLRLGKILLRVEWHEDDSAPR